MFDLWSWRDSEGSKALGIEPYHLLSILCRDINCGDTVVCLSIHLNGEQYYMDPTYRAQQDKLLRDMSRQRLADSSVKELNDAIKELHAHHIMADTLADDGDTPATEVRGIPNELPKERPRVRAPLREPAPIDIIDLTVVAAPRRKT